MTDRRSPLDFYAPIEATTLPRTKAPAPADQPSLGELWRAGRTQAQADLPQADRDRVYDAWSPIVERLNQGRPAGQRLGNPATGSNDRLQTLFGLLPGRDEAEAARWAEVERARERDPSAFADLPKTLDEFHDRITAAAKAKVRAARQVSARNDTWAGSAVGFGGQVVTSFQDPVNLMTLPVGGAGRSVAARIVTEALANAGAEAIEQPLVAEQRKILGQDLSTGEAVANVAAAAVFGAGFQAAGEGAVALARSGAGQRAGAVVGGAIGRGAALARDARSRIGWNRLTDDEKAAVTALERTEETAATTPFTGGGAVEAHLARVDAAMAALNDPRGYTAAASGTSGRPVSDWDQAQARRTTAPAGTSGKLDLRAYAERLAIVESGGNWQIGAKTSSAYGMYQITRGTWLGYADKAGIRGTTDDATWAKRTNPAAQEAVFNAVTRDNRAALARAGAPETAGNLYLMHFAGTGGGTKILRAAPDTPIDQLMTAKAIEANDFLRGKTAQDVIDWAHRKMNSEAPSGPVLSRAGFDEDDAGDVAWRAAQDEVETAERSLADAQRAAASDVDDDIPFDLDDPRRLPGDTPARDPFAGLADEVPSGANWEPGAVRAAEVIEPPVAEGFRRVYHSGAAGAGTDAGDSGRWVSTNRQYAADYRPDTPLFYRDLPADDPRINDVDWPDQTAGTTFNFELTPEEAVQLRQIARDMPADAKVRPPISDDDLPEDGPNGLMNAYLDRVRDQGGTAPRLFGMRATKGGQQPLGYLKGWSVDRADVEREIAKAGDGWEVVRIEPPEASRGIEPSEMAGFDTPDDVAAIRQMDSLEHDLRMWLAEEEAAGVTVRLTEDGDVVSAADAMDELDADEAAIDAAWACMTPEKTA